MLPLKVTEQPGGQLFIVEAISGRYRPGIAHSVPRALQDFVIENKLKQDSVKIVKWLKK
ncbi:hypothetical protein [Loigolactobacillus iwatensis]|uniref:hypothetical protein n=1 Tax=Loigolactobacillus iwatensis TaxID=1267156 RepID=UPI0013DE6035|nr:hypothetical protein [Loigolactobacillus iwatensis]